LKSFVVFADILEYGGLGEDNACDDVKYNAGPAEERQESFVAVICGGMCLVVLVKRGRCIVWDVLAKIVSAAVVVV
jgi:hypothetical protein